MTTQSKFISCDFSKTINSLINLTDLNCCFTKITNEALVDLVNLTKLDCSCCYNLFDHIHDDMPIEEEIARKSNKLMNVMLGNGVFDNLINLTDLNCSSCSHIFDKSIAHLSKLTKLDCNLCNKITGLINNNSDESSKTFSNLVNLTILDCSYCTNMSKLALVGLDKLTDLDFRHCCDAIDYQADKELLQISKLTQLNGNPIESILNN